MHKPCKHPFYSLAISAGGNISPCTGFTGNFGKLDNIPSLTEHWNLNPQWTQLREKELQGQWTLPGCGICKHNENKTLTRKDQFEIILPQLADPNCGETKIKHLDIAFSNSCNLTCIMCNSYYSSAWLKHDTEFSATHPWRSKGEAWSISNEKIDELIAWLPDLESLEIKGGEPLFDKKVKYFLQKVIESGRDINVRIVTNFTAIDSEMVDILKKIPRLTLNLSIDGIGKTYEWMRGFSFEKLENNILTYLPELVTKHQYCIFHFVTTAYNVNHIVEYWNWIEQLNRQTGVFIFPSFALIGVTPQYTSPLLAVDTQNALSDIDSVIEKIGTFPAYNEYVRKLVTTELVQLKEFLKNERENVSQEMLSQHQEWHKHLVKIRGWDIHQASI